jgi:tetratricopeptide (TPR) repeat protein
MIGWWLAAHAEVPLPSYKEELIRERWAQVDAVLRDGCSTDRFPVVCVAGVTDRAIALVDGFQRQVTRDAGLEYLAGLAHRYAGQDFRATRRLETAVELDPARVDAWYDLGELRLARGDTPGARTAFTEVARLRPRGELAWLGPWRLAEVAATERDAANFERHLEEALRLGFTFRHIAGLENWRRFYADPALRDTLDKLLTVYATPDIRDSLQPSPSP